METIASILLVLAFCAFVAFIWFSLKQAQPKAGTRTYNVPGVRLDVTDDAKVAVRQRGGSTVIDINYAGALDPSDGVSSAPNGGSHESIFMDDTPSRDVYVGHDAPSSADRDYWRKLNAIVGLTDPEARERLIKLLADAGFIDDVNAPVEDKPHGPEAGGDAPAGGRFSDGFDNDGEYYSNEGAGGHIDLDSVEPPAAAEEEEDDDFSETTVEY